MTTQRTITVDERRARMVQRHHLAPLHRAGDVVSVARDLVCLHATDPATVYLSAWARMSSFTVGDLDVALYDHRSLIKHLAMRRTLFVFPRSTLAAAQAGASARLVANERRTIVRDVEKAGLFDDGAAWLDDVGAQILQALDGERSATTTELRKELPLLDQSIVYAPDKSWGGNMPVGPRVLTSLSAAGLVVRGQNHGSWNVSRPSWVTMRSWLGAPISVIDEAAGIAELVSLWLRAFGPGTEQDIKWWLGSTLTAVRKALTAVEAVAVDLDGIVGYVLPDDVEPVSAVAPSASLLPSLDPTTMGWTHRHWYLGEHKTKLFDRAGNAGPTVWWDGHIVGGWVQNGDGEVCLQMLEDIGTEGMRSATAEAERLTAWLGGKRIVGRFPSPLSKELAG